MNTIIEYKFEGNLYNRFKMAAPFISARLQPIFTFLNNYGRMTFFTNWNLVYKLIRNTIIKLEFVDKDDPTNPFKMVVIWKKQPIFKVFFDNNTELFYKLIKLRTCTWVFTWVITYAILLLVMSLNILHWADSKWRRNTSISHSSYVQTITSKRNFKTDKY